MIGTRQADPFYLESPSGEFFTSPFLLAFATVPYKLPLPEKSLIGEKSSSGHLIGARWYDPELAVWMSPDPLAEFANPYSYVGGDVMNLVDPDGMATDDICPSCPEQPEKNVRCPEDGPWVCPNESIYADPLITGVAIAAGVATATYWSNRTWINDVVGDWFGGGGGKRSSEGGEANAPFQNQVLPQQPIAYPSYGGYSLLPNPSTVGSLSEIPADKKFDFYWNRGKAKQAQSTHWDNGTRYVDDIPTFLSGLGDQFYALPFYGSGPSFPNTTYGMVPSYVSGPAKSVDALSIAGKVLDKGGLLTKAGRAAQKHGSRPGSVFPPMKGHPSAINPQGQFLLDDILTAPGQLTKPNRFGGVDIYSPNGRGARFDSNGNFMGFLEP